MSAEPFDQGDNEAEIDRAVYEDQRRLKDSLLDLEREQRDEAERHGLAPKLNEGAYGPDARVLGIAEVVPLDPEERPAKDAYLGAPVPVLMQRDDLVIEGGGGSGGRRSVPRPKRDRQEGYTRALSDAIDSRVHHVQGKVSEPVREVLYSGGEDITVGLIMEQVGQFLRQFPSVKEGLAWLDDNVPRASGESIA